MLFRANPPGFVQVHLGRKEKPRHRANFHWGCAATNTQLVARHFSENANYSRSLVDYWGYFAPSYFGIFHRGHLCWSELLPNFERVRALGCSRRARPRRPCEIYPLTPRIGCGQERQAHHLIL